MRFTRPIASHRATGEMRNRVSCWFWWPTFAGMSNLSAEHVKYSILLGRVQQDPWVRCIHHQFRRYQLQCMVMDSVRSLLQTYGISLRYPVQVLGQLTTPRLGLPADYRNLLCLAHSFMDHEPDVMRRQHKGNGIHLVQAHGALLLSPKPPTADQGVGTTMNFYFTMPIQLTYSSARFLSRASTRVCAVCPTSVGPCGRKHQ